jgi:hypothetical protein
MLIIEGAGGVSGYGFAEERQTGPGAFNFGAMVDSKPVATPGRIMYFSPLEMISEGFRVEN